MLMLQRPEITQEDLGNNRTKFVIEPLEPGFGLTLGNTMRRALLSRVPGVAVTGIKIDGVNHEFTSIPGVVEDVLDLLLNLKRLVLKVEDQENHTLKIMILILKLVLIYQFVGVVILMGSLQLHLQPLKL